MQVKRLIKSLINSFLFIINAILWIFNMSSVGEMATGIKVGQNQKEKMIYGLCSLVQYMTYALFGIGMIITIYWWFKDELSIAERLSGLKQSYTNKD